MAYTPQHSPVKKPASQSQEDLKTYEVIDDPMHDDEAEPSMSDEMQPAQDKLGMSPPVTQIKISESQVVVNDQEMDLDDAPQPAPISSQHRQQNRTPEPTQSRSQGVLVRPSPSSPGRLEPFDWEDFESRYQKALAGADHRESELLEEFENLVKVRP